MTGMKQDGRLKSAWGKSARQQIECLHQPLHISPLHSESTTTTYFPEPRLDSTSAPGAVSGSEFKRFWPRPLSINQTQYSSRPPLFTKAFAVPANACKSIIASPFLFTQRPAKQSTHNSITITMTASVSARRGGNNGRGFAQKSDATRRQHTRTDRDGDLMMAGGATAAGVSKLGRGRPRGRAGARGQGSASGSGPGPERRTVNVAALERVVRRANDSNKQSAAAPTKSIGGSNRMLQQLRITNWKGSGASTNADGGVDALIKFLEKRGNTNMKRHAENRKIGFTPVKIKKYQVEGDALIIWVLPSEFVSFLKIDGYQFVGVNISVQKVEAKSTSPTRTSLNTSGGQPSSASELKALFTSVLEKRFNREQKLLDLSALGQDADLQAAGIFNAEARTVEKVFPAMMKVCDIIFKSAHYKKENVHSITLAGNSLASVGPVTTLAPTFKDLRNLDLSNNVLPDLPSMEAWRKKFPRLELLILSGNPLTVQVPQYKETMKAWYPRLRSVDNEQIRTDSEMMAANVDIKDSLPVLGPNWNDEGGLAEAFVTNFFVGYDNDRDALVDYYYDDETTFSLAVNSKAMGDPFHPSEPKQRGEWEDYIKFSRNLKAITHPPARNDRLHTGAANIKALFNKLPATRHPNILQESGKWSCDCQMQYGVPDARYPGGVGGFLITIHSEFEEVVSKKHRSFDRTFILGPGPNGVRVVKEMLTVRTYGGCHAWQPEQPMAAPSPALMAATPAVAPVPAPQGADGLTPEQKALVEEVTRQTNMKPEVSMMCLGETDWDLQRALAGFQTALANGNLGPEAFLS
ncbi:hypothetical protein K402DRAFT_401827 [Aulographum hederae CBS 113979]|uniref:NTF2-like protein n=1 Tax=Aulographum hederae CBS 113979 TaxID=1176131 RepID=A0A6G1H950_9PEZI|nr:hypothetical protein K402DRAFT_401827 [Aulographum hederae CBS 113979]